MRTIRGIPASKSQGITACTRVSGGGCMRLTPFHREALVRDRELPHEEDDGQQSQK